MKSQAIFLTHVAEAAVTVLITTLDDCVWLVPFLSQASRPKTAVLYACTFVGTLFSMAVAVSGFTLWIQSRLSNTFGAPELVISTIGALFCWILAAYLFYHYVMKRRRRQQQRQAQSSVASSDPEAVVVPVGETVDRTTTVTDESVSEQDYLLQGQQQLNGRNETTSSAASENDDTDTNKEQPTIWMVMSLTFLGSLDEISYFPGLILGGVFSPIELCLGTLLAALVMLLVVTTCLRTCQPLMDVFDRIPLFAIVGCFALLLTAEVIVDLFSPTP